MNFTRAAFIASFATLLIPAFAFASAAPFANTLAPTSVTEKSATLHGSVNPSDTSDTYQWFEWGISGRSDVYETAHSRMWSGTKLVNTSANIYGLAPNTSYFYRQVAENGNGKVVGVTTYFTTKSPQASDNPVILAETRDATKITETSALLGGYVSPHENTKGSWWFEWGTTTALRNKTKEGSVNGYSTEVSAPLSNLMPGTMYYFRLATLDGEREYGDTHSFTTAGISTVPSSNGEVEQGNLLQIQALNQQIISLLLQLVTALQTEIARLKGS